jgi:hypothetical protein
MCSSLANAIHLGTYAALAAPRVTIFDLRRVPRGLLPSLTPILQTLALTPELLAAFPHSSATLRTNTIQNAGDHIRVRLHCAASYELHVHFT